MRITAGILMIMVGLTVFATSERLYELSGESDNPVLFALPLIMFILVLGGSIAAFRKKSFGLALTGAICSIVVALAFGIVGILSSPPISSSGFIGTSIFYLPFILMSILSTTFLILKNSEFSR
ncbi:MAG: hypothetical protein PHQ86_05440 [Dehalococcoidales bacterium]|nr:hypothetical protein [Dehalococcoidales bacterium]